jgi:GT2 family glycosyltransferase
MAATGRNATGHFVGPEDAADVAVLVVTYQSARDIGSLIESLRAEASTHRLRVIVADNASTDGTMRVLCAHPDVIVYETGGNLGYAAGVNTAARAASDAESMLVLNADLRVKPGCIEKLRKRQQLVGAGVVVPRIVDAAGNTYTSLRYEPSLIRALGDAAFGGRWASRPSLLSEIERRQSAYEEAHMVDWATGAALLIDREVANGVGDWDERFFLYSEETDFLRRVRQTGSTVWYEPDAVVQHSQGGSGSSVELDILLTVNRIRYAAKYGGPLTATLTRAAVALHELARSAQPAHRAALRTVLSKSAWESLPRASRRASDGLIESVQGAIIIPAHNEAGVIGYTLKRVAPLLARENVDVIVVANGCVDDTAAIARSVPGVTVLELPKPSKTDALNEADRTTDRWPRIYLDADIGITLVTLCDTLTELAREGALAGRPPYVWSLDGATWPVRAYYQARDRIPSAHRALWGAGVYALSADGRRRFDEFPAVVADDLFVDQQYTDAEKQVVQTDAVRVRVPRSSRDLLKVLRRQTRGARQLHSATSNETVRELTQTIRGPRSLFDALVYAAFALLSRRTGKLTGRWERDESSRSGRGKEDSPA